MIPIEEHYCQNPSSFPLEKFHQKGTGKGKHILIVGESPAENGWRKSSKAFYNPDGKILPTGKRLNQLLSYLNLSIEKCGFTELAKCFVGKNRKILDKCSKGCWPIFLKQLKTIDYKLIIILGVKTLEIFNKLCGVELKTGTLSKVKIDSKYYFILPIYHPSPINPHNQKRNQIIFESLKGQLLAVD